MRRLGYEIVKLPIGNGREKTGISSTDGGPETVSPAHANKLPAATNIEILNDEVQPGAIYVGPHISQKSKLSELLDELEKYARPLAHGQKVLIWPFERTGATGHLAMEPFYIKSLYGNQVDDIVVVTRHRHSCHNSNTEIFDVAMANMKVACTDDQRLLDLSSHEIGVIERGPFIFLLHSYAYISRAFFHHCMEGGSKAFFQLTETQEARGQKALKAIGIPSGAKWVVAHAREPNFHPRTYDNYRCTSIESYYDSIKLLVEQDYFVLRIGDRSMKRLPDFGPRVLDIPFLKKYDFMIDVFAIAHCDFMISAHSGPCMLARAFDRPCLAVNVPVTLQHIPGENDMLAWRQYYRQGKKDQIDCQLSYQEILDAQLHYVANDATFSEMGIKFGELTAAEVLPIAREMIQHIENQQAVKSVQHERFMSANNLANDDAAENVALQKNYWDWYGCAKPGATVPNAYCDINPNFL